MLSILLLIFITTYGNVLGEESNMYKNFIKYLDRSLNNQYIIFNTSLYWDCECMNVNTYHEFMECKNYTINCQHMINTIGCEGWKDSKDKYPINYYANCISQFFDIKKLYFIDKNTISALNKLDYLPQIKAKLMYSPIRNFIYNTAPYVIGFTGVEFIKHKIPFNIIKEIMKANIMQSILTCNNVQCPFNKYPPYRGAQYCNSPHSVYVNCNVDGFNFSTIDELTIDDIITYFMIVNKFTRDQIKFILRNTDISTDQFTIIDILNTN